MDSFTQANRALALATPLGPDALLLEKLSGVEALSDLFRFRLQLLARTPVDFGKVLNQWATVRIALPNGSSRYVNGMIARLSQGGQVPSAHGKLIRYSADLVPALWRLTKRIRSRIFQNQSVPEILKHVLGDAWRLELSVQIAGQYEPRNYCVQHAESDFAFVSRLMEEEGIAYYFTHVADERHEHDKHVLVLTDRQTGFGAVPDVKTIAYRPERGALREAAHVWDWDKTQEVPAGLHSLSDYHFEVPANRLAAQASVLDWLDVGRASHPLNFSHRIDNLEMLEAFEFPAGYAHRFDAIDGNGNERGREIEKLHDDTRRVAKLRAEEAAAWSLTCAGASSCAAFLPGHVFTLTGHFDADDRYLLTRVEHRASVEGAYGSQSEDAEPAYENRFQALPAALPFRPRRLTPRPRIDGLVTATVTGPKGSAVHVDPHGRVKVKFHWDRDGAADDHSSCWVRVSQPWAGPHYGAFFWPRPGHEVVVGFEYGDPDRPLITGSVYNADNPPPSNPKDQAHLAGFKTASLGANALTRYNAIVFDDRPNQELIQIHAETGAVSITEASSVSRSAAPSFEVNGRLVLPIGSGSGGGFEPETFKVLAGPLVPAFESLVGKWKEAGRFEALAPFRALEAMGESLVASAKGMVTSMYGNNSKTTFTIGGETKGIFFGNRKTHITCGAELKYVVDPISMFFGFVAGKAAAAQRAGSAAQYLYKTFIGLTDPISLVAPPIGGAVDLICCQNLKQTYIGPKIDVNRCEKYELSAPSWSDLPGSLDPEDMLALLSLQVLTIGRLVADTLAATQYNGTGSESSNVFLNIVNGGAMDRLHGFLGVYEKIEAIKSAAVKKTEENQRLADIVAHEAALAVPGRLPDVPPAIPRAAQASRLNMIDHLLKKTRVDLHNAQVLVAGLEQTLEANAGANVIRRGDWNVTAKNMTLSCEEGPGMRLGEDETSTLRLEALGRKRDDGVVDVVASGRVVVTAGLDPTNTAGFSKIVLNKNQATLLNVTPEPGSVPPVRCNHVMASEDGVLLAAGKSRIHVRNNGIELRFDNFVLVMNEHGIGLGVNDQVIHLAPDKLELYGAVTNVYASSTFEVVTDQARFQTDSFNTVPAAPGPPPHHADLAPVAV